MLPLRSVSGRSFLKRTNGFLDTGSLTYSFSNLQERNLEQVVAGADVWGDGKRADGVMKTRGAIAEALCLVEIKKHDTDLLKEGLRLSERLLVAVR